MEINIEQLKTFSSTDLSSVNKLLKQLNKAATSLTKVDMKEIILSSANRLFVARRLDNKEIIGMLTMVIFRIPFVKKGLLEDIVVDRKHRGKGIATKLIAAAVNNARTEGVSFLDFTSRPTRVAANNLYKRLGFKIRNTNIYRIEL